MNNNGNPQNRPPSQGGRRPAPRPVNQGGAPRQPSAQRPATAQSGYRRAPETQRTSSKGGAQSRPPINYGRQRKRGVSDDFLKLMIIILSVLLVFLVTTFIILKSSDSDAGEGTVEPPTETTAPSESAGATEPNESAPSSPDTSLKEWRTFPENPRSLIPVSDNSTVTLSSSKIYSGNIIMVDRSTGKAVCEYGADTKIFPASMTKLMTVIVACELIEDMNDTFTFTNELLYTIESGATQAYFIAGNPVPMKDLIYGVILPSGADACLGLAVSLAGSEESFVDLMNQKAAELGCTGTHFMNVSGLHHEEHYSTVRDIATIMAYAMENPFLRKVISARSYKTIAPVDRADGTLYCNWLSGSSAYSSANATMFGAKSGYTEKAGRCLASISRTADGKEYIIVSAGAFSNDQKMGSEQSFADVKYLCDTYVK